MDPRLLGYYNRELQHVREMGGEFAREYPKIAGRLGLDGFECADPYVERLLEGFSFLAARVQMKLDSEFSTFTRHLLELVYPTYLAPTPSMAVVQFHPDLQEGQLAGGVPLPRGTTLRSLLGKGDQTPCEFRTAAEVMLFPLRIEEAAYYPGRDLAALGLGGFPGAKAGLRLRLKTTGGQGFHQVALDRLPIFLQGPDELPMQILEQLIGHSLAVGVRSAAASNSALEMLDRRVIQSYGFDDEEALLPFGMRSFHGYRLVQEYFAFPERFRSVDLQGLEPAVRKFRTDTIDLVIALDAPADELEGTVDAENFLLFCAPAVNLFTRRADRIHVTEGEHEYHVIPDRTRPLDYEVCAISEVEGIGATPDDRRQFLPFYALHDTSGRGDRQPYYAIRRLPRALSAAQKRSGARSHYVGHEVFISIVDATSAPFPPDLRQLSVKTLCTNRDLPLHMPIGRGNTDFSLVEGAPVESVRCVAGPTRPRLTHAEGETAWRLINHLSLNYLSLCDSDEEQGAAALREILRLYAETSDAHIAKQVEGLRSVRTRPVTRRLPGPGPITFGRGLEVTVQFDEYGIRGERHLPVRRRARTVFRKVTSPSTRSRRPSSETLDRGEVVRWPARTGRFDI